MSYQGIIIAAKAAKDSGKTVAIRRVWTWLKEQKSAVIQEKIHEYHDSKKEDDVTAVLEYQGVRIGISSKGDPGIDQEGILNDFIKDGCRIIICACRTRWTTKEPIDALQDSWRVYYVGPSEDGFISKEEMLEEIKMAVQKINCGGNRMRDVWKVGSRWSENGAQESTIADIFERYNVVFSYTEAFLDTRPGDLVAIADGERVIAVGIILSPAMSVNQLNIAFSDEDKERVDFSDRNVRGCIVRYHWFKDYSWLPDNTLKKSLRDFSCTRKRFFHAWAIEKPANDVFFELEDLRKRLEEQWG